MYRSSFLRLPYFSQLINLGLFVFTKKKQFYLKARRGRPAKTEEGERPYTV